MSVVGIDFGTQNCVISAVMNRGVDIVANEESSRTTPAIVGFTEKMRALGPPGKTQQMRNLRNTLSNIKRLVGRSFEDPLCARDRSRSGRPTWTDIDGSLGVSVQFRNERRDFRCEQIAAMLFSKLRSICESATQQKAVDFVISVPSYFSNDHRNAVINAGRIAGLNVLGVINDLSAVAMNYGFYRFTKDFTFTKPIRVMFVDFGASHFGVNIAEYSADKVKILGSADDPYFGGSDVDVLLAEVFARRFQEKYKLDIHEDNRAWSRLVEACEKAKKTLNTNPTAPINVECVMNDRDLVDRMTKEEYHDLLVKEGCIEKLKAVINKVLAQTKLQLSELDEIEWVGSGMRTQVFQKELADFVGRTLKGTTNAEESIAKGATLRCAQLSLHVNLRPYALEETNHIPIDVVWHSLNDPSDEKRAALFGTNAELGPKSVKNVTFPRKGWAPFEFRIEYTEDPIYLPPRGRLIGHYRIADIPKPAGNTDPDAEVRVKISLDANGIAQCVGAELVVKKEETVEVPVEEKKDVKDEKKDVKDASPTTPPTTNGSETPSDSAKGDDKMDTSAAPAESKPAMTTKVVVKKSFIPLKLDSSHFGPSASSLSTMASLEEGMRQDDLVALSTADAKNAVETHVYDTRERIGDGGIWSAYTRAAERDRLNDLMTKTEEWLYGDGEDVTKAEYDHKLRELTNITKLIADRLYEAETIPLVLTQFTTTIDKYRSIAKSEPLPSQYDHLAAEMSNIVALCDETMKEMAPKIEKYRSMAKTDDPVLKSSDLKEKIDTLTKKVDKILNMPKPKPPPEPKKETTPSSPHSSDTAASEKMQTDETPQETSSTPSTEKMDTSN